MISGPRSYTHNAILILSIGTSKKSPPPSSSNLAYVATTLEAFKASASPAHEEPKDEWPVPYEVGDRVGLGPSLKLVVQGSEHLSIYGALCFLSGVHKPVF